MKIAQSNVNLVSSHKYYEENSVTVETKMLSRSAFLDSLQNQEKKLDQLELSDEPLNDEPIGSDSYMSLKPSKSNYLTPGTTSLEEQVMELRNMLLERILRLLEIFGGDGQSRGYAKTLSNTAGMLTDNMFVKKTTIEVRHIEAEETTFSGKGTALTEDGRVIDFGVGFSMSRKLCQYAGIDVASAVSLIDPLVINVGSDVTHISDQNFFFDLDADGKEEKIARLSEGAGFLALDRNEDGKINDGSELFGTKSGDGFKDLAIYDLDGNGWIDESDDVYNLLKIWIRNEDGTDTLLGLKEADVGAIHLGRADTEYAHYGAGGSSFMVNGMTRASGVFLRESGGVGTVQQVDLAAL